MFRVLSLAVVFFIASLSSAFAAPSARDFGTLPQIADAALSPDGDEIAVLVNKDGRYICLLYTSPSPRDLSTSRMPSSA